MKQPEKKQSFQKRIRAWDSRRSPNFAYFILIFAGFFAVYFGLVEGKQTAVDFIVSFSAGLLGIMAGLSLDGALERAKENRTKQDFLALMRNELKEIRGKIPPQTKTPLMLYPEMWDSFISSGLMKLLSAEQATKLSSVYRFVKGTQYEAEWVRRRVEEYESIPDSMREEKEFSYRRYKNLQGSYETHGAQLTKAIDGILKETWLG